VVTKPRLLLFCDDLGIVATLFATLEREVIVERAASVSGTLARLGPTPPDLVILQADQVSHDVLALLELVAVHAPTCQTIVIAPPAVISSLHALPALAKGGVLGSPVKVDELLQRIGSLLAFRGVTLQLTQGLDASIRQTLDYIARHYSVRLTVPTVAKAVGVSPGHLAKLFRRQLGLSVHGFVNKIRVQVAKCLLVDTTEKLHVIAERSGFCDASHLSRVFGRDLPGSSPGRYRRRSPGTLARIRA
jgi:AraC-like DNA-binding protein